MEDTNSQPRPETGPMEFPGDLAGIFIRGDHAMMYRLALEGIVKQPPTEDAILNDAQTMDVIRHITVQNLIDTLASCDVRLKPDSQKAAWPTDPTT